jgi:Domain of unknown function (DUF6316)
MRVSDTELCDGASSRRLEDRSTCINGEWYYHTREGVRGPFPSQADAENELAHFINVMQYIESRRDNVPFEVDTSDVQILNLADTRPFS